MNKQRNALWHTWILAVLLFLLAACAGRAPVTASPSASSQSARPTTAAVPPTSIPATPAPNPEATGATAASTTETYSETSVATPTVAATSGGGALPSTTSTAAIAPTVTATPAPPAMRAFANMAAWDGAVPAVQAGTTFSLALPPPSDQDSGRLPAVAAAGLPAPKVAVGAEGGAAITLPIPASALGHYTLLARWPDGSQERFGLNIGALATLATGLGTPDDVAVAPDGSLLYGNLMDNTVNQLLADGSRRTLVSRLNIPEGLAVTGPATLLIADQGSNRVLAWTSPTGLRTLLQLPVRRGVDGIDGLSAATVDGRPVALLPDSANGRMSLLRLDNLSTVQVPGSWQRPTAAALSNGLLYLVDEYGGRLWRGPLQGPLRPLGPNLNLPDDVTVTADGTVFVNDLGQGTTGGRVTQINSNGSSSTLLAGLNDPQGMALDSAGNLILTESGNGRMSADVRSCLPILLGSAQIKLQAGGPALGVPFGSACVPGEPAPTFALAPGATWPATAATTWSTGAGTSTLALANGVTARLQPGMSGATVLVLQPPAGGPAASATLAVQMHVGSRTIARQIVVTVGS